MTLVLLNDVDDSRVPQLFFGLAIMELRRSWRLKNELKNRQMRDETNNCLSVSVKKTNKDAQTLKHSVIVKSRLSE